MTESIFYTILQENGNEIRLNMNVGWSKDARNVVGHVRFNIGETSFTIDNQQLSELGSLFIALSGIEPDEDDIGELLDGYDINL